MTKNTIVDFTFSVVGDGGLGELTNQDRRYDEEKKELYSQSPFPLLADDGEVTENGLGAINRRGCLLLKWQNLYDNLNAPFWGKKAKAISSFGLILRPQWDLSGSHYLVKNETEPHLQAISIAEDTFLVSLDEQLKAINQEKQPFGQGTVVLPLPYDRVGVLEVGFYGKDTAFPKSNVTINEDHEIQRTR